MKRPLDDDDDAALARNESSQPIFVRDAGGELVRVMPGARWEWGLGNPTKRCRPQSPHNGSERGTDMGTADVLSSADAVGDVVSVMQMSLDELKRVVARRHANWPDMWLEAAHRKTNISQKQWLLSVALQIVRESPSGSALSHAKEPSNLPLSRLLCADPPLMPVVVAQPVVPVVAAQPLAAARPAVHSTHLHWCHLHSLPQPCGLCTAARQALQMAPSEHMVPLPMQPMAPQPMQPMAAHSTSMAPSQPIAAPQMQPMAAQPPYFASWDTMAGLWRGGWAPSSSQPSSLATPPSVMPQPSADGSAAGRHGAFNMPPSLPPSPPVWFDIHFMQRTRPFLSVSLLVSVVGAMVAAIVGSSWHATYL